MFRLQPGRNHASHPQHDDDRRVSGTRELAFQPSHKDGCHRRQRSGQNRLEHTHTHIAVVFLKSHLQVKTLYCTCLFGRFLTCFPPSLISALVVRFLTKRFIGDYERNAGNLYSREVQVDGDQVTIQVQDTPSVEVRLLIPPSDLFHPSQFKSGRSEGDWRDRTVKSSAAGCGLHWNCFPEPLFFPQSEVEPLALACLNLPFRLMDV